MVLKAQYDGNTLHSYSEDTETVIYRHISRIDDYQSLTYLQKIIDKAKDNVVHLTHDYKYMAGDVGTGVVISNPLRIHGHGHTIDGEDSCRIFSIPDNSILNDLNIMNCREANHGGAITHTTGTLEINKFCYW